MIFKGSRCAGELCTFSMNKKYNKNEQLTDVPSIPELLISCKLLCFFFFFAMCLAHLHRSIIHAFDALLTQSALKKKKCK